MKKLLISIGGILIMAFVIVLFVNAVDSKKDPKKAKTEIKKDGATGPCSATCMQSSGDKTTKCDPEKCKEMKCDPATCTVPKDGKCDPAACTTPVKSTQKECPANSQTTACPASCQSKATEVK
jgi:hypothetical protein